MSGVLTELARTAPLAYAGALLVDLLVCLTLLAWARHRARKGLEHRGLRWLALLGLVGTLGLALPLVGEPR